MLPPWGCAVKNLMAYHTSSTPKYLLRQWANRPEKVKQWAEPEVLLMRGATSPCTGDPAIRAYSKPPEQEEGNFGEQEPDSQTGVESISWVGREYISN